MWLTFITFVTEFLILIIMNASNLIISDILITFFIIFLFVSVFIDLNINKKYINYRLQIICAFLFRILLLYIDIYLRDIFHIPHSGTDSEGYYNAAVLVSSGLEASYGGLYSRFMGFVFSLIGVNRLFAQSVNIIFSITSILILLNIFILLNINKDSIKKTLWVVCLLPNFAFLSSIFMRESIMIMLISLSLLFFVKYFIKNKIVNIFIAIFFVVCASSFHAGCFGLAIGYIITLMLYNFNESKFSLKASNLIVCIFISIIFIYLFVNYSSILFGKFSNISDISDISSGAGRGGSTYAQYVGNSSSPLNMLIFTIPRIFFFLFSPLPFQWRGITDIMSFLLDSMFYFISIVYAIRAIKHSSNKNFVILQLLILLPTLIIFGWGVTNTGTAIRHRCKIIMIFASMFACGLDCKKNSIKES